MTKKKMESGLRSQRKILSKTFEKAIDEIITQHEFNLEQDTSGASQMPKSGTIMVRIQFEGYEIHCQPNIAFAKRKPATKD